jgi:hypothetical protein
MPFGFAARRLASAGLAVTTGAAAWVASAGPAAAVVRCDSATYYSIGTVTSYHIRGRGLPVFKDGPGGTMEGSVDVSTSASATISAGASAELSGVIASAKVEVSSSLTRSVGVTVGHRYTHRISAHRYGHMQYGSWGRKVSWRKIRANANCTTTVLSRGTAWIPTRQVGWKYWETRS